MDSLIETIRDFNRWYTTRIGALDERYGGSDYSLTQSRILYEIANHPGRPIADLVRELGLDQGYISRTVSLLTGKGLVQAAPSPADRRQRCLSLTEPGSQVFAGLDAAAVDRAAALVDRLSAAQRETLQGHLEGVKSVLAAKQDRPSVIRLRSHRTGDMGWVVEMNAKIFSTEYGFDERCEALVAEVVADFLRNFDPARERCWIAVRDGDRIGSVFLVKGSEPGQARLRLLQVDSSARGLGVGKLLVDECVAFAKAARYDRIALWTQSSLTVARSIYEKSGFVRISEERHTLFGPELIGEIWELDLGRFSA
jgi:DNA-binding MarR family transcriptional regulator/GNAT superfamily N-acetyltransferase